jgi:hypothetical protein
MLKWTGSCAQLSTAHSAIRLAAKGWPSQSVSVAARELVKPL